MRVNNLGIRLAYEPTNCEEPSHVTRVRIIADGAEESYTVNIDEHSERQIDQFVGRFKRLRDHIRGIKDVPETDLIGWDHDDLRLTMKVNSVDETGAEIVVTTFAPFDTNERGRTYEVHLNATEIEEFILALEAGVNRNDRPVDVKFSPEYEQDPDDGSLRQG